MKGSTSSFVLVVGAALLFAAGGCDQTNTYRTHTEVIRREKIPTPITTNGAVTLDLFLVSSNASPGARFIDTEHLPKLGYISAEPDLTIHELDELELLEELQTDSGGRKTTNWAFEVALTREDGRRFADLTSTNLLRRLLIVVGKEPIIAPTIFERIEGGQLHITGANVQRDYVKTNLARLRR